VRHRAPRPRARPISIAERHALAHAAEQQPRFSEMISPHGDLREKKFGGRKWKGAEMGERGRCLLSSREEISSDATPNMIPMILHLKILIYMCQKIQNKFIDIRKMCVYVIYNLLEPISKYTLRNKKDKVLCE
jgi:hypothetical protein